MEAIEQLKDDLREGRIDADRLVDLIVALRGQLQASQQRIAELEKQVAGSGTAKVDEAYSMKAEEKRQEARGKKKPNSRTNKTAAGARRQTILTSVLQSLRVAEGSRLSSAGLGIPEIVRIRLLMGSWKPSNNSRST